MRLSSQPHKEKPNLPPTQKCEIFLTLPRWFMMADMWQFHVASVGLLKLTAHALQHTL